MNLLRSIPGTFNSNMLVTLKVSTLWGRLLEIIRENKSRINFAESSEGISRVVYVVFMLQNSFLFFHKQLVEKKRARNPNIC